MRKILALFVFILCFPVVSSASEEEESTIYVVSYRTDWIQESVSCDTFVVDTYWVNGPHISKSWLDGPDWTMCYASGVIMTHELPVLPDATLDGRPIEIVLGMWLDPHEVYTPVEPAFVCEWVDVAALWSSSRGDKRGLVIEVRPAFLECDEIPMLRNLDENIKFVNYICSFYQNPAPDFTRAVWPDGCPFDRNVDQLDKIR